jgi:hypothetical protein
MRDHPSASCSTSGRSEYDVLVHHHHRVGHRHTDREHARRRSSRSAQARPVAPVARPRGSGPDNAYAYLFFPPDRSLTEEAYERLKTIGEATELGSGFKIAMRDLEILVPASLLGTGQSVISRLGYDLYCQMVTEAVAELKERATARPAEIKLELPFDAHLPKDYVGARNCAWRRIAGWRRSGPPAKSMISGSNGWTATVRYRLLPRS